MIAYKVQNKKVCNNPESFVCKTIFWSAIGYWVMNCVSILLVKMFYLHHFSRVVSFRCKISTTAAPLTQKSVYSPIFYHLSQFSDSICFAYVLIGLNFSVCDCAFHQFTDKGSTMSKCSLLIQNDKLMHAHFLRQFLPAACCMVIGWVLLFFFSSGRLLLV